MEIIAANLKHISKNEGDLIKNNYRQEDDRRAT
jgi:hypothetical protein